MYSQAIINNLPSHWEMWTAEESKGVWCDDGRDCDKPMYLRKDGLARIYYCSQPSSDCVYSIVYDYHSDGDCQDDFGAAVYYADAYIEDHPLQYYNCKACNTKAVWHYLPSDSISTYYCNACVPRGCSCNIDEEPDADGLLQPCCEYGYSEYGYPIKE